MKVDFVFSESDASQCALLNDVPKTFRGRRLPFSRCLPMVSPRQRVGETPTIW